MGKTFAMLDEGWRRRDRGTDVVIGFVETHQRPRTETQIRDLPIVPRLRAAPDGTEAAPDGTEMDLDAILARHPEVALVDELGHTNPPGGRHEKRWQDVDALLDAGIDVISTLDIAHLSSLSDTVTRITGTIPAESVPDAFVRGAEQIELVDMSPEALRRRLAHGNIYPPEELDAAHGQSSEVGHSFEIGTLGALRELALLWVADRVDDELASYRLRHDIHERWETKERIVVGLSGAPGGDELLRRAARIAARTHGTVIGVHVRVGDTLARPVPVGLESQRRLLSELGGRYAEVVAVDTAEGLISFAKAENATQLIVGATARSRRAELLHGSLIGRVIRDAAPIDVHIISPEHEGGGIPRLPRPHRPAPVPTRRRNLSVLGGVAGMILLGLALSPLQDSLQLSGALLIFLLAVVAVAALGGLVPAAVATVVGVLTADFLFAPPTHSFRIFRPADVVAIVVFFAASGAISLLVDQLARRGLEVARSRSEAESLARLAGGSVLSGVEALPDLVSQLRETFALDYVAVLAPDDPGTPNAPVRAAPDPDGDSTGWRTVVAAGGSAQPVPPEAATFTVDADRGTVLVLAGHALAAEDSRLLAAFVGQLRLAQERTVLESEAAAAAVLAEANDLRSALLAAVSHDLRTPLASIKAAVTSLLSTEVEWGAEDVRAFCETIDDETDRLTGLVGNLLDMGRLQAGVLPVFLRPVAVEDAVQHALVSLSAPAAVVTVVMPGDLPMVQADSGLLERVLANLISNAQKWSPDTEGARVEAGAAGDHVEIRVVDRGPGIPPEARSDVFLPFQQLGDASRGGPKGVGLGLAVAKGFTEAMGGAMTVEETAGGGTTMVLSVPIAATNGHRA